VTIPPDRPPLPSSPSEPVALADWLELVVLTSADGNSSDGDLQSALTALSDYDASDERIECLCDDAFGELQQRRDHAPGAYPFRLTESTVERDAACAPRPRAAYEFCLCLSNRDLLGVPDESWVRGTRLFELLCGESCRVWLGGEACRLGWPRGEFASHPLDLPAPLAEALDALCRKLGEGGGAQPRAGAEKPDAKDAGVDVVAWRHFPDHRAAKLVVIGSCATGRNWRSKLGEANHTRLERYLREALASQAVRALFTPRRLDLCEWDRNELADVAGLLMDRCRVAYCASVGEFAFDLYRSWVDTLIAPTGS
jgi:hypothetical protein